MYRRNAPQRGNTVLHRNGEVTLWDVYTQQWVRGSDPSDQLLASLDADERDRVLAHLAKEPTSEARRPRTTVQYTDTEWELVCKLAAAAGKTVAAYIRERSLED